MGHSPHRDNHRAAYHGRSYRRRSSRSRSRDKYRSRRQRSISQESRETYERKKGNRRNKEKSLYEFSDSELAGDIRGKKSKIQDNKSKDLDKQSASESNPRKSQEEEEVIEKEQPNFEPSGILAEFSNQYQGVVLKFTEPLDAALPTEQWRLYPFKGEESFAAIPLSQQSAYLIGKDKRVADVCLENPSISSQHVVIQFRERHITRELSQEEQMARGDFQPFITETLVQPYLMDLESTNKTFLNGQEIEAARYYELREKDILRFGESAREYVLMKK